MDPSRLASLERSIRLLKTRTLVLSVLLFVSVGANAAWVHTSSDPPIRVYTATLDDTGAGGAAAEDEILILPEFTREHPRLLASVKLSGLGEHRHRCLVTASAQVQKGMNASSGIIVVGLSQSGAIIPVTERPAHLVETADEDQTVEEVTTTFAMRVRNPTLGDPVIRFSAAYDSGGILTISKRSMTVVCLRNRI